MIVERWKNAQSYIMGKLHIQRKMPCQDRTYFAEGHGVKVIALADGAGSKSVSEIGAEIVCKETCNLLIDNFNEYLMCFEDEEINPIKHKKSVIELSKNIIRMLLGKLKEKALDLNIPVEDLSSTLLFFAIKGEHYISGHIGDGVIAGLFEENNSQRIHIISDAENGAKSNITFFIPDSDSYEHLRLSAGTIDNLKGVLLTSDGAGTVLFNKTIDSNVIKLFNKFFNVTTTEYNKVIKDFLNDIISLYSNDDLSLNILLLEDVDLEVVSDEYKKFILDNIKNESQIIRRSEYCYLLDSSIDGLKTFDNYEEVEDYLC